jgi:alkylation response protein AidB-like acyl-CoA dehydrogenase
MGQALLPGPFFATALLGSPTLLEGGSAAQKSEFLPKIAAGDLVFTLALAEASGRYDAGGVALGASTKGNDFILSGEKLFVPDAHIADYMIVAARSMQGSTAEEGISLFLVDTKAPGVSITQLKTVDMTRRQCHVVLQDVAVPASQVIGEVNKGWPILQRVLDQAMVGLCTEMVGTGQKALDIAVAYAKERVQFGKPIGSFQAVKHKCVDMMVAVENARSLVYYAAWAVDENVPEAKSAVPMTKAYCSDMCKTVTSEAIQVHGGIGFTWEHDMHLFYRRALASEAAFGSAPLHREMVAQTLNL